MNVHRQLLFVVFVAMLMLLGCKNNITHSASYGKAYEVVVINDIDSLLYNTLSVPMKGLPQIEPTFDVVEITSDKLKGDSKLVRNIVVLTIDKRQKRVDISSKQNVYAQPQVIINIVAPSQSSLQIFLKKYGNELRNYLIKTEMHRAQGDIARQINVKAASTIYKMFGIRMQVPPELTTSKVGKNFLWLSNNASSGMVNFCIYSIGKGKFAQERDSVMRKNILGEQKGMYMRTASIVSMVHGYKDPRWMTFNQIRDEGYHLEKGSKGAKVEYWFPFDTIKKKGVSFEEKERLINEGERKKEDFSLVAKYYTVFNGDNISGLPEIELPKNEIEPSVVLEQISRGMNVEIYNDGEDRAFYRPSTDDIHLPLPEVFSSDNEYNAVAFHELGHATGHESRLNRDQSGVFGTSAYAKEELVAEITSAFMAETTGINLEDMNMENHKAYVNGWITSIEDDPEYLMKAISQANDAADYMQQFLHDVEIDKSINFETREASWEFHDKFYKFGVMLNEANEIKALNSDGEWATWFNSGGGCLGNTDQLNIWLSNRGDIYNGNGENWISPTQEDVLEILSFVEKHYDIEIPKANLGKVVDLEDFASLYLKDDKISSSANKSFKLSKSKDGDIDL